MNNLFKVFPEYKEYIWGGNKLKDYFIVDDQEEKIGELWLLSSNKMGDNIIKTGDYSGKKLSEYFSELDSECTEIENEKIYNYLPIIIKLIDATEPLSIQVHPNDKYALKNDNELGKDELWYIIDCKKDSKIFCGFNKKVTRDEVIRHLDNKSITGILNSVTVEKGQVIFIPSGTIHAIGEGIVLCEVQNNSNSTYRLYDYDRFDLNGKKRSLQIEKALDVLNYNEYHETIIKYMTENRSYRMELFITPSIFVFVKYEIHGELYFTVDENTFVSLVCISGMGNIDCSEETIRLEIGETVFIKANSGSIYIRGNCTILLIHLNYT